MAQVAITPNFMHAGAASPQRTGMIAHPPAVTCAISRCPRPAPPRAVRQGSPNTSPTAEGCHSISFIWAYKSANSRRCGSVAAATGADAGPAAAEDVLRVSLPTAEAKQSIKFALARAGRETAVIINRLNGGSAAAEAGVRPGQRLLSISDPMSPSGMWELNDRPSIRFVRDALAMRSSDSIDLVLSRDSLYAPGAATASQMSIDEIDTGSGAAAASRDEADGESAAAATSVGQQLQEQYEDRQAEAAQQQSAFERRQRRRREYSEKESARDDGAFFAISAAVILLPALAILAIAFFSGYLDRLSDSYSITR